MRTTTTVPDRAPIDLSAHVAEEPYDLLELRRTFEAESDLSPHIVGWLLDHIELKQREQDFLVSESQDNRDRIDALETLVTALRARIKKLEGETEPDGDVPSQAKTFREVWDICWEAGMDCYLPPNMELSGRGRIVSFLEKTFDDLARRRAPTFTDAGLTQAASLLRSAE